jgi:hypothetical protein
MKKIIFVLVLLLANSLSAQTIEQIKAKIKKEYTDVCKELNDQLPIKVDEVTTLNSIFFINWTCVSNYIVKLDFSGWSKAEINELMKDIKANNRERAKALLLRGKYNMTQSQFKEFMKTTGIKWEMKYYDENAIYIGSIIIDYNDF